MSRGPGALQLTILGELSREPGVRLPWHALRKRFPHEVRDKSFYRAIRSLRRRGLIFDQQVAYGFGLGGRIRYVALAPTHEMGARHYVTREADRDLIALVDEAQRQLKVIGAARGLPKHGEPTLAKAKLSENSRGHLAAAIVCKRLSDYCPWAPYVRKRHG